MDLFVSQISEASSSINPFETPTEQQEQCDCMGQKKNCWSLMLFSNTLVVAVSVAILGTNRY